MMITGEMTSDAQAGLKSIKKELKDWEHAFHAKEGRKPDKTDIAKDREIAKRYKAYAKLKAQYDEPPSVPETPQQDTIVSGPEFAPVSKAERRDDDRKGWTPNVEPIPLTVGQLAAFSPVPGPQPQRNSASYSQPVMESPLSNRVVTAVALDKGPTASNSAATEDTAQANLAMPKLPLPQWGTGNAQLPTVSPIATGSSILDGRPTSPTEAGEIIRKRRQSFGFLRSSISDQVDVALASPVNANSDFDDFLSRKRQLDALQEEQKKKAQELKVTAEVKTVVVQQAPQQVKPSNESKRLSLTQPQGNSTNESTPTVVVEVKETVGNGNPSQRPPRTWQGFVADEDEDQKVPIKEKKEPKPQSSARGDASLSGSRKNRVNEAESKRNSDEAVEVKYTRTERKKSRKDDSDSEDEIEIPSDAGVLSSEQTPKCDDDDFEDPRSIVAPAPLVEEDKKTKSKKTLKAESNDIDGDKTSESTPPLKEGEVDFPIFGRAFPATGLGLDAGGDEGVRALFRRIPKNAVLRCKLFRKTNLLEKNFPSFFLYNEADDKLILAAKKRKQVKGINYTISETAAEIKKESKHYIAKLRANQQRTMFVMYDARSYSVKANNKGLKELSMVEYSTTTLPREMIVAVPATAIPDDQINGFTKDISNDFRMRSKEKLLFLRNKPPRWNETTQSHCLNFGGRVTMPSIKNFQLIADADENMVLMQFGRCGPDFFTLDVRYPMTPIDAFGIALSTFDAFDAA